MNKAAFLDRDGVLNVEKGFIYKPEEIEFIDGVFDALQYLQNVGYLLFIITNQSGIARGYFSEADFLILTDWMEKQFELKGIHISKVYFSPYHSEFGIGKYKKDSVCRKPKPGMIFQAAKEFNIDLPTSILIGDRESDIETGINAGVGVNILVKTGFMINEKTTKANFVLNSIKNIIGLEIF